MSNFDTFYFGVVLFQKDYYRNKHIELPSIPEKYRWILYREQYKGLDIEFYETDLFSND